MSDLISRADAIKAIGKHYPFADYDTRELVEKIEKDIERLPSVSADRPTVVHCRECVRKKNCWMFDEHKDDNGTCVWAEPYYITESPNDVDETDDEVIERPIIEHDREWIIGCIKHDGFIKTDRFDKANQIILDALADRPSGEWQFEPKDAIELMFTKPKCSICGFESADGLNYCPNCGARMKGGGE